MTDPKAMIVQLTVGELQAMLNEAAAKSTAGAASEPLEYLTLAQAAKLVGIDERTVTNYVKKGLLIASKLEHSWRFLRTDVVQFMKDRHYKVKKAG